ncbi:MAG: FAD-dependent oxidoreductase [candidate division Zixibacteria bacterium]|nr:FAD-dependent oxidoreductase [candidate division Zixibacteria bacterium]
MVKVVKKKKKGLKSLRSSGGSSVETSSLRPKHVPKKPPCGDNCPNGNHIRLALMTIALAEKHEKPLDQAMEEAFYTFLETTPFPSTCGRVCPHPCETGCNRNEKDGAVGINKIERFLGDYGLEHKLVPKKLTDEVRAEKVAVVGSGPAGITCAYHLARRGYQVTVFEAFEKPGGMLRYGIPDYRLPPDILDAEIQRVCDMGVELKLNTAVGKDVSMDDLRKEYKVIFVSLGAHQGRLLRVEGENAPNVFTGTGFLHKVNAGETVEVGDQVVVVGGGDTAIDAARIARRLGANATILYRRTRTEMPAIDEEIVGAEEEGVRIDLLAAPIEIYTDDSGKATGMKCQRMELGEPDDSGRRRPVPIEGDTYDLKFTTLIAAISQEPDFTGFESLIEGRDWIKVDDKYKTKDDAVYAGGDNINLALAIDAISHGRVAAFAIHEMITGEAMPDDKSGMPKITADKIMLQWYEGMERVKATEMVPDERLKSMTAEIVATLARDVAIQEAKRCMSCGMCFDCTNCWSYCQDNAVIKPLIKGEPYKFKLEYCNGCKKCAENCPCGYIEMH